MIILQRRIIKNTDKWRGCCINDCDLDYLIRQPLMMCKDRTDNMKTREQWTIHCILERWLFWLWLIQKILYDLKKFIKCVTFSMKRQLYIYRIGSYIIICREKRNGLRYKKVALSGRCKIDRWSGNNQFISEAFRNCNHWNKQ